MPPRPSPNKHPLVAAFPPSSPLSFPFFFSLFPIIWVIFPQVMHPDIEQHIRPDHGLIPRRLGRFEATAQAHYGV
jgi:hypothetical protein